MSKEVNIRLFVGEDDFLVERAAKKALAAYVPEECRASAVETIDGAADAAEAQLASLRACDASLMTPPFLDPVKLTWWRNVTFLPGGGRNGAVADGVKTALEKFARRVAASPLPPNQFLIVTAPHLLATSIFAKTLAPVAETAVFNVAKKANERRVALEMALPELAAEEGLKFASDAAAEFVTRVGTDTRTVLSEIAKLRTYLGRDGTVTKDDVAAVCSAGDDEPEFWDLTNAVGARNAKRFLSTLAAMSDPNPIMLATVFEKFFRELVVYRDALERGWLSPAGWSRSLAEDVRRMLDEAGVGPGVARNPWAAKNNARTAANYRLTELRVARARMMKARERLVSTTADDQLVVSELLRIMRKA